MYYEINVAHNGRHYFATAEHSLRDHTTAEEVYNDFLMLFPEEQGYEVSMTRWQKTGYRVEVRKDG